MNASTWFYSRGLNGNSALTHSANTPCIGQVTIVEQWDGRQFIERRMVWDGEKFVAEVK